MPHLFSRDPLACHDPASGRTVLVAPRRDERPGDVELATAGGAPSTWCPFCAGNEHRTPPAVVTARGPSPENWRARIFANLFPFVGDAGDAMGAFPAGARPAHGVHEVVVESPRHDTSILSIDPEGWRDAWWIIRERLADLAARGDLAWGTVFKNSGPAAGASLEHVHSQLVAMDFVPAVLAAELAAAATQQDPFGELIRNAENDGRIVTTIADLVALVPAAPRQPCETWILPRSQEAFFHATSPERVAALADLTRDIAARFDSVLPDTDFNWWLHEAPWRAAPEILTRWHWHLEVLPRATQLAGFELGTGCHVTAWPAAEAAARLREGPGC
jgi:UDPglucose--hexose-1-phosphate uridylyltransferase